MARVIMFANQKGGVGKTTVTMEVSYLLSRKYKVLMMDLDGQCNLTNICGIEPGTLTIYDSLMGVAKISDVIQTVRPKEGKSGVLDIMPGNRKMLSQYFTGPDDSVLLKELVSLIEEYRDYDYITLDVGPESGQIMTMALLASNYVVAVTILANLGYSGVVQMCADLRNGKKRYVGFDAKPLGILLNGVKRNNVSVLNKEKYEELAEVFGAPLFHTELKNSCIVDECKEFKQALTEYKPKSELAGLFEKLVKEMIDRMNKIEKEGKR